MLTLHNLLIVNAVLFGMLFAVWSKSDIFNAILKLVMLGTLIFNLYFLFGGK